MTWKEFVTDVENVTLNFNKMVELGIPVAELFSPPQAQPVEQVTAQILPTINQAIRDHQTGGATQQTATIALANIASTVANAAPQLGIPAGTAQDIITAATVATGLPEASFTVLSGPSGA